MSNHWHGVVTDPEARLPEFLERFHRLVAKAQNASLGRWENLWSSDKTSAVLLVDDADVLEKMAYTISNPVTAGLVRSPFEWPGVISLRFAAPRAVEMPDVFFDDEGELDDDATLQFTRPDVGLSDAAFDARLNDLIADRVRRARMDMLIRGLPFVGRNTVLRQPFFGTPRTPAPRRNANPRIAAKRTRARIDAIRRMLKFQRDYRDARLRWRDGDRDVVFPAGTYLLRVHSRVACSSAVPP
jgi:hypothetical protein